MFLKISIIVLLVCALLAASAFAQEDRFKCQARTKYRKTKVSSEIAERPYYPQFEEYCEMKSAKGTVSKEGPYRLWGPNGEKFEEGQYLYGKKDRKWVRWIPTQILEDTWRKGEFIDSKVLGTPSSFTIDFGACIPHGYSIDFVFGSTSYEVTGKEGNYCKLSYSSEMEQGQGPQISCIVPTNKGKIVFFNTGMGMNFSSIEQYCKK